MCRLDAPLWPGAGILTSTFTLGSCTLTLGTLTSTSGTLTFTSGTFTRIGRPLPEPPDPDPCPDPRLEPRPDPRPDPFVDVAVTVAVNAINQTYQCVVRYIGKKSFINKNRSDKVFMKTSSQYGP